MSCLQPSHPERTQSCLKRNELSRHEETWRNRKCILRSERSQSGKCAHCTLDSNDMTFWRRESMDSLGKILAANEQG